MNAAGMPIDPAIALLLGFGLTILWLRIRAIQRRRGER